ncbi:MAG: PIN domain-containing protein [Isosphaeraceae bacterium]
MPQRFFDSTKLITELKKLRSDSTRADAERLAHKLIEIFDTKAIVSPVEIEVLAGVRDPHELELTEFFLAQFVIIDHRRIPPQDWKEAGRIAKRVIKRRRQANPQTEQRQLGDCLIIAIANRLHYEFITDDKGMVRQAGRSALG